MEQLKHFLNTTQHEKDLASARQFVQGKRKILHDNIAKNNKKYNYRYTGASVAYGPIYAPDKETAKKQLLEENKVKRIPGLEIWETQ